MAVAVAFAYSVDGDLMARWDIYADLSRALTPEERSAVFEAVDELVPGSGCVGSVRGRKDEIYFAVDAGSVEEASVAATRIVETILLRAGLPIGFRVVAQRLQS